MLRDIKDIFRKLKEEDEEIVFDAYKMREGLYIRFDPRKSISENLANIDGNYMNYVKLKDNEQVEDKELFDWFKARDYLSNYIEDGTQGALNKSIDSAKKMFHNTNQYTLFVKEQRLLIDDREKQEEIVEYVGKFMDLVELNREKMNEIVTVRGKDKESERERILRENFGELYDYAISEDRKKSIERMKAVWSEGIYDLLVALKVGGKLKVDKEKYIRIFFDVDFELYELEYRLNACSRIFIRNEYNVIGEDGLIRGASYNDTTFSKKKPFLEKKALTITVNDRMTVDDALENKDVFYWLGSATRRNRVLSEDRLEDFSGTLRDHKKLYVRGSNFSITDFDNLTQGVSEELNVEVKNYVTTGIGEETSRYLTEMYELKYLLSNTFFAGRVSNDLYYADDSIGGSFNKTMSSYMNLSLPALIDWFYKGRTNSIRHLVDKMTYDILGSLIVNAYMDKKVTLFTVVNAMNVRLFLLEYLKVKGKSNLGNEIVNTREWFETDIKEDDFKIETTDQFYYAVGQLIQYLNRQSKRQNSTLDYVDAALRKKNSSQLKRELERLTSLYGHNIHAGNVKFKRVLAEVMLFEDTGNVKDRKRDMLMSGLVGNCAFFAKKEFVESGLLDDSVEGVVNQEESEEI